ncbi:MAG: S-adenosylmethionine:tRNA ribosyltransferase-isomerase [Phycisphaerales bacterium]|nr:S-adenosylmethionine:tRNA ribosyltransferase-isomerase [Phycisphaerales bacterium]
MLRTADLEYHLPPELIATQAVEPRDAARLMVVSRSGAETLHRTVRDLPDLLTPGDLLVFNSTRVLPARLHGRRVGTGGRVGGLFLSEPAAGEWTCLLKGGHLRPGVEIELLDAAERPAVTLVLLHRDEDEPGAWRVRVQGDQRSCSDLLEQLGQTPLPPYILGARASQGVRVDDLVDRARYQTVFAHDAAEVPGQGSVAAPTAGLHFTPELLGALTARGIHRAEVVLHVGTGTFKPVETEYVEQHPMHAEWCSMPAETIAAIRRAANEGRRVIPVGTTSARTIEAHADAIASVSAAPAIATRLLITPGYQWRCCTGLMTNFHLPRSTLLAMLASMFPEGIHRAKALYADAIERRYRFYSYGDAMLVLP